MYDKPLSREEMIRIVEGKGAARRVPIELQHWIGPQIMGAREGEYRAVLEQYPCDVDRVTFQIPETYHAPADAPDYRWLNWDEPAAKGVVSIDGTTPMEDWSRLDEVMEHFPDPNYAGLIPSNVPPSDGRYRLGMWWYWLFERFWSLRGMENALCDFYESPDQVHRLFRKLTDFYKVMIRRGREELHLDAVGTSDDIGTQSGPFFSLEIFRTFFKPYYKELIDCAHENGMHFWMHCCGNILPFIPELIEIGLDVLHPIQKYTMDEREVAEKYGADLCIWAGFDVQRTIPYGTPEDVRKEVRFMLDTYFRKDGHLILTAGNNMTVDTPLDSLEAVLNETLMYGTKLCNAAQ